MKKLVYVLAFALSATAIACGAAFADGVSKSAAAQKEEI
jgi:hypothetical protein